MVMGFLFLMVLGLLNWTKAELSHFDVITCRVMTSLNSHHPCSALRVCIYVTIWEVMDW